MAGEILSSCRSGLGASQHFALPPTSGREAEMVDPPVRAIFSLMHCSTRNCWINPKTVPLSNDHRTAAGRNGPVPKDPVMVGKGNYRRSLESGTRKPRPKGVGSAGREARPGRPLPVTSEEKGALSVARRRKG